MTCLCKQYIGELMGLSRPTCAMLHSVLSSLLIIKNDSFNIDFRLSLVLHFHDTTPPTQTHTQSDHHDREDDGRYGRLEGPEDSQTDNLDQGEEMDSPQRNVTQEGEVWLVLGWHQIQLDTLPELGGREEVGEYTHT